MAREKSEQGYLSWSFSSTPNSGELMRLARQTESNGSGVPRMFDLMREAGLPVPNFKIDISSVTVELSRHGLLDAQTSDWLVEKLGPDFSNTQGIALVLAKELGAVSPRDLRNQTGHDSEDMRSLLDALVDRGILHHNSQSQYQLATSSVNVTQSEQEVLDAINKNPCHYSRNCHKNRENCIVSSATTSWPC